VLCALSCGSLRACSRDTVGPPSCLACVGESVAICAELRRATFAFSFGSRCVVSAGLLKGSVREIVGLVVEWVPIEPADFCTLRSRAYPRQCDERTDTAAGSSAYQGRYLDGPKAARADSGLKDRRLLAARGSHAPKVARLVPGHSRYRAPGLHFEWGRGVSHRVFLPLSRRGGGVHRGAAAVGVGT